MAAFALAKRSVGVVQMRNNPLFIRISAPCRAGQGLFCTGPRTIATVRAVQLDRWEGPASIDESIMYSSLGGDEEIMGDEVAAAAEAVNAFRDMMQPMTPPSRAADDDYNADLAYASVSGDDELMGEEFSAAAEAARAYMNGGVKMA